MKGRRVLPYIFLFFLFVVIIFILGTRYGKVIEQGNKNVNYLLSIPPTKPASPTPTISYLTYSNKGCGFKLLYPSDLKPSGESSTGAVLKKDSVTSLFVNCEKSSTAAKLLSEPQIATQEVTFKNRKIMGRKEGSLIYFAVRNPYTGIMLYIGVEPNLLPLIDNTLQFTP